MAESRDVVSAEFELEATTAAPGQRLSYALVNTGAVPVSYGAAFALRTFSDDEWVPATGRMAFRLWAKTLAVGERVELAVNIPEDARAGRYRISKHVHAGPPDADKAQLTVCAEFEVATAE
jgi:uncharacterized protein (DUF849 family)